MSDSTHLVGMIVTGTGIVGRATVVSVTPIAPTPMLPGEAEMLLGALREIAYAPLPEPFVIGIPRDVP